MSQQKVKPYSAEFKERAVKLAVETDQTVAQTARDLGINENTLHTWLSKYHQGGSCGGLQTKQPRLANKGWFGLTLTANKKAVRPTIIENELTMIATGLQTALSAHIRCE